MIFSTQRITKGPVTLNHRLKCLSEIWSQGLAELRRRGEGRRESGAFLLGTRNGDLRRIQRFIFYNDLDPLCLRTGIVIFHASGYGKLWRLCREMALTVVADIHTHPKLAFQSMADRRHPMIATSGHIALIVPNFALCPVRVQDLGIFEYKGDHKWIDHSGNGATKFFYIGNEG